MSLEQALRLGSSQMAVAQPARAALRTLRCLASRGSTAAGGRPGGSLAGSLLLRQAALARPQAAAFSTSRPGVQASAAAADTVEAQQVAAPAAAAARDGVYQSQAYPFTDIEAKWQAYWEEHKTFRTPEFHELDTSKPKFYALDMFPYPRWLG